MPVPDLRPGVRLAVDVGTVRIGVARCDAQGILATPVRTVSRKGPEEGLAELAELVREHAPIEVIVGLPRSLHGGEGSAAQAVRAYSGRLSHAIDPVPVRLVDERLTTVSAHQALHAAGRSSRKHRSVVDQVAAVMILQAALDSERNSGTPPGTALVAPVPDPKPESEEDRR